MRSCGHESIHWSISQVLGPPELSSGHHFSCLEFNAAGDLLAVGDKGGHVTIFGHNEQCDGSFYLYCTFTSHEPEFDYLKSLEVEEKINSVAWLPNATSAHHLLSTNDKTIKLWRISELQKEAYNFNVCDEEGGSSWSLKTPDSLLYGPPIPTLLPFGELRVPRFRKSSQLIIESRLRRSFSGAHTYHINSISVNSDQETFLSADDLRVNLWHLEVSDQSFNIVDTKPSDLEDLSEVITCARFHPSQCHLFAYSTSRGAIRLCDMRAQALCDNHTLAFEDNTLERNLDFFSEIIASLSDFRFAHSGQHLLTRDYLTLKVWDMRMGDRPCELYTIHEPLCSQLCMLYESDSIFDKFLCSWSTDDRFITTGSYGNLLRVFDRHKSSGWLYVLNGHGMIDVDPESSYPISLHPKHFISRDDPVGVSMGLPSICVTSIGAFHSVFDHLTTNNVESSSNGRFNESTGQSKQFNSYHRASRELRLVPKSTDALAPKAAESLSETVATCFSLSHIGSKRRRDFDSSCCSSSDCSGALLEPKPQRRRRKQQMSSSDESSRAESRSSEEVVLSFQPANSNTLSTSLDQLSSDNCGFFSTDSHECAPAGTRLCGSRLLDYQRKLLCVAWHPRSNRICAASACQLYIIVGTQSHSSIVATESEVQDSERVASNDKPFPLHVSLFRRSLSCDQIGTISSRFMMATRRHRRKSRSAGPALSRSCTYDSLLGTL